MAVMVPLLLLGGLEVGLRLCGFGYPTGFFLPAQIDGRRFYVTNEKFGYRFFPPSLARTPLIMRLADPKPANSYRIFLLGESAAQGDPDPSFGAGRYLEVLLRERYPGTGLSGCLRRHDRHQFACPASHCPRMRQPRRRFMDRVHGQQRNRRTFRGRHRLWPCCAPGSKPMIKFSLALKTTKIGQLINTLSQAKLPP